MIISYVKNLLGEEACVFFCDRAVRIDGHIVSENLGAKGILYGFRAENELTVKYKYIAMPPIMLRLIYHF